jgi:translation initiation factor IF-2
MAKQFSVEAPGPLAEAEAKWLKAEKGVEITAAQVRAVLSFHGEFQKSDARKAQRAAEAAERKADREAKEQAKVAQEAERLKKVAERVAKAKANAEAAKVRAEKAAQRALDMEAKAAKAAEVQQPDKPSAKPATKPQPKAATA